GRGKAWHIGTGCLKLRERRNQAVVVKIVIDAEVLAVANPMIELNRELVTAVGLDWNCHQRIAGRGSRNELKQVHSGRVHTGQRNLIVGKDGGVSDAGAYGCSTNSRDRCLAPRALVKRKCVVQVSRERALRGKI